jgi:ABC-type oligopeptide transport system substrate-binding subunit
MKAADAEYSLRRLLSGESKRPDWLKPFVTGSEEFYKDNKTSTPLGIKATDEYTLTITLTQPFAPFIQHLCTSNCAVIPREAVENTTKPFARNPVGVGATRTSSSPATTNISAAGRSSTRSASSSSRNRTRASKNSSAANSTPPIFRTDA